MDIGSFFKTDDYIYKPKGGFSGDFGSSDYKYSSGDSGNKWEKAAKLAAGFLKSSSSDNENRYRNWDKENEPVFGKSNSGGAFALSPELNVVYPQQQAPVYIPGTPGQKSFGQRLVGSLVGGAAGFASGGPVGAFVGGASPWIS